MKTDTPMNKQLQVRISFTADDPFYARVAGMSPTQIRKEAYYLIKRGLLAEFPAHAPVRPAEMPSRESAASPPVQSPAISAPPKPQPANLDLSSFSHED
jgi:hypothetical protein